MTGRVVLRNIRAMKIDLSQIDRENFRVDEHIVAGETCYLVQPKAISAKWNKHNLIFRSSVWNAQGEPVSLSFKKFFNWEEQPDICSIPKNLQYTQLMEKLDGSTLIVSKYKGELIVRTRGTVDATKLDNGHEIAVLKQKYPRAFELFSCKESTPYTLLFEWVSPVNKIVLNYGDEPDLYLIGCIDHLDYSLDTQDELDKAAKIMGVKRPRRFNFNTVEEMISAVEAFKGQEGICVYYNNGQDIKKCKSSWYLALHRMKSELGSFERIVDFYFTLNRPTYQDFYNHIEKNFDYELASQVASQISSICDGMKEVYKIEEGMFNFVKPLKNVNRKEAAEKILQAYGPSNRAQMAFCILDDKKWSTDQYKKLLYQSIKK